MTAAGVLEHTDILIRDGRIAELGAHLAAPAGAELIEASGRAGDARVLRRHRPARHRGDRPGARVDDYALKLGAMRPEFDVTLAFDPDSAVLGRRAPGRGHLRAARPEPGRKAKAARSSPARAPWCASTARIAPGRALFVDMGGDANALSGGSRAAQFMLLDQAIAEVRNPKLLLAERRAPAHPVRAGRRSPGT